MPEFTGQWNQKKRLSLHACGDNPINLFFKSYFLEICERKEFLGFFKNKLISLSLQRNVLNLLLRCLDHFRFQSQKNKKTQNTLCPLFPFLLISWICRMTVWVLLLTHCSLKEVIVVHVFLYPLLLQVLRMLWWHFPDQRQKTEDSNYGIPEQHRTGEDSEIPEDRGGWLSINKFLCPP